MTCGITVIVVLMICYGQFVLYYLDKIENHNAKMVKLLQKFYKEGK